MARPQSTYGATPILLCRQLRSSVYYAQHCCKKDHFTIATTDIRIKRMNDEYQSVRNAQDELFDKVDTFEEALLALNEQVVEINEKLDAIMAHLDVPYKPPARFVKE